MQNTRCNCIWKQLLSWKTLWMSDPSVLNIICFQTQKQLPTLNNTQLLHKGVSIDLHACNLVHAKTSLCTCSSPCTQFVEPWSDSCEYQLLSIVHEIYAWFDCNPSLDYRAVFLGISKAFDRVWHDIYWNFRFYCSWSDVLCYIIKIKF